MVNTPNVLPLTFKAGFQINNLLLVVVPIIFLIIFSENGTIDIFALIFNIAFVGIIFYVMFSRYGCKVSISGKELRLVYLVPWRKTLVVKLHDYKYLSYGRSFYSFPLYNALGYFSLFRICYDVLILANDDKKIEIKINTIRFGFKKMISFLRTQIGLKEINPNISKEIIW